MANIDCVYISLLSSAGWQLACLAMVSGMLLSLWRKSVLDAILLAELRSLPMRITDHARAQMTARCAYQATLLSTP